MNLNEAKLANDINSTYTSSKTIMIVISIIGLILAILIGLVLSNDIDKPLQVIRLFGEKLAEQSAGAVQNIQNITTI